ncbi:hypothetical protein [Lentilactobacillus senioris]|uniref:hypothetical protein n=1 Tax=Lentilactobacillus senioris TaxID=931534 RepID=UPI003D2D6BE1
MKMRKFFAFISDILPMLFFIIGIWDVVIAATEFNPILGKFIEGLALMVLAFLFGLND